MCENMPKSLELEEEDALPAIQIKTECFVAHSGSVLTAASTCRLCIGSSEPVTVSSLQLKSQTFNEIQQIILSGILDNTQDGEKLQEELRGKDGLLL